ncbi:hypothetical protein G6O69_23455 [Pseudenhygromyxa sp. WMMC2535]|uniref:hypothetical protein n=1 Tax=Pseudenhygromyxa sp. WMMC2535 TaxID=2712867 RepID=UPI00155300AD|nr:hypothetical protein [Pseudenhygromyxa sp. WMMC2535]NVB40816.1 hypothetical protein [Pseudenhygromyxa sp. WMMC2535]
MTTPLSNRMAAARAVSAAAATAFCSLCSLTLGCRSTSHLEAADQPAISTTSIDGEEGADQPCKLHVTDRRDPTLDGAARTSEARCCDPLPGLDPELIRASCGFSAYLGGAEELACVHHFADDDGRTHSFRVTPLGEVPIAEATALHRMGMVALEREGEVGSADLVLAPVPGIPGASWSRQGGRRWAYVDGPAGALRIGWPADSCPAPAMIPVLAALSWAGEDDPSDARQLSPALPRLEFASEADAPIEPAGLLAAPHPASHEPPFALPRDAEAVLDALMRAAAEDDLAAFLAVASPDARLGLPDRRKVGARALRGADGGREALTALRRSAARMPATAPTCPRFDRRLRPAIARGELPMWCMWIGEDGLDLLVFALRAGVIEGELGTRVEYIGLFPEPPRAPLELPGEPPAPAIYPRPELSCGDPHVVDYPGLCPDFAPEDEGESESEEEPAYSEP